MVRVKAAQVAADVGAATSVGGAIWTHVAHANEILQLIASLVAVIAGVAAAYYHISRAKKK
jgi:hypothetical protein